MPKLKSPGKFRPKAPGLFDKSHKVKVAPPPTRLKPRSGFVTVRTHYRRKP